MSTENLHVANRRSAVEGGELLRRGFDLCCAAAALVLLAPLMLAIALAIWLESGAPIFFSQVRLGRHGRPFRLYKFRKFNAACGSDGAPLTMEGDCRLTAIGRFLALTKFDEFPQFWNVLRGDMSVVGPRPESLAFADCFNNGFERVLDCKPGLFGPSQALFRHEQRFFPRDEDPVEFYRRYLFPAKARIDLDYFARRSFFGDLGWVIRGVLAVVGLSPSNPPDLPRELTRRIGSQELDGAGT